MKKIIICLSLIVGACAPVIRSTTIVSSVLINETANVSSPNQGTLVFNSDDTFVYTQSSPFVCTSSGTWVDNNVGLTAGNVQLNYVIDNCNNPSLINTVQTYQYNLLEGILIINL